MRLQDIRLSPHFLLSDLVSDMHDRNEPAERVLDNLRTNGGLDEATALCTEMLEPMMLLGGPCSIAAGWSASAKGPHNWATANGAAVDAAFHDWVNADGAPIKFCERAIKAGIPFERLITYAGSEFMCIAHRKAWRRNALYENVRVPGQSKPHFVTYASIPAHRAKWPAEFPDRPHWRRLESEVIYHGGRRLRAHHIRVGRYFTLHDFTFSETAFAQKLHNVPPVTADLQIGMARCMAELLDPFVAAVGRVSVVRGAECKSVNDATDSNQAHRWMHAQGRVEFVTGHKHWEAAHTAALNALAEDPRVVHLQAGQHTAGGVKVALTIRRFAPAVIWSSGRAVEPDVPFALGNVPKIAAPSARGAKPAEAAPVAPTVRVRTRPNPTLPLF